MNVNVIYNENCLGINGMCTIHDKSVDLIICDLPYGVTKCKWDSVLDLNELWNQYLRIIKGNGCIILFGQDKFSAKVMLSNESMHRYNLIWEKTTPTGHLNSKKMPLRSHEDIMVFYKKLPTYHPQKTYGHDRKVSTSRHKRNSKKTNVYNQFHPMDYDSTERFPKSILNFSTDKQKSSLHPTQKPVLLIEYLIKTYSNEGDIVLDNCMGSGTTAIACINTNRNYIGFENNEEYYKLSIERIQNNLIGK